MSNIKVLGVGSPILDILVNVEEEFIKAIDGEKGGMELVSPQELDNILDRVGNRPTRTPGGSAANTIFGLANFGIATAFLGKTGKDSQSDFYCSQYEKMGGDLSCIKRDSALPTGRCLSLITPDSERTMRTDLGAASTLSPSEITSSDFSGISHVHIEGYMLFNRNLTEHILKIAKECDCVISLDLASFEVVKASLDILPDLLKNYIDIIFANEDEAAAFADGLAPNEALEKLSKYCNLAVVKLGKDGALIKAGTETEKIEAVVAKALDTTGAGDLWASGFLSEYLRGGDLAKSGYAGSVTASQVVQIMGASIPAERWDIIKDTLKNR